MGPYHKELTPAYPFQPVPFPCLLPSFLALGHVNNNRWDSIPLWGPNWVDLQRWGISYIHPPLKQAVSSWYNLRTEKDCQLSHSALNSLCHSMNGFFCEPRLVLILFWLQSQHNQQYPLFKPHWQTLKQLHPFVLFHHLCLSIYHASVCIALTPAYPILLPLGICTPLPLSSPSLHRRPWDLLPTSFSRKEWKGKSCGNH